MTTLSLSPLNDADMLSLTHIFYIYDGVQNCSLPKAHWTHYAHLVAGLCRVSEAGLPTALDTMPDIIRRYNLSTGGENTDHDGYHHTVTLFYLKAIWAFLRAEKRDDLLETARALLNDPVSQPDYLLGFYDRDILFSPAARRNWVAPQMADR